METQRPFRIGLVALALLTVAGGVALTRVFAGAAWLAAVVICVALAYVIAQYSDRLRWSGPVTADAHVGAMWLTTMLIVEPTTAWGIPTPTSIGDWFSDFARAPKVLRGAVVPVPPRSAALLLALVAIWTVAAASSWSRSRLSGTVGALIREVLLLHGAEARGGVAE